MRPTKGASNKAVVSASASRTTPAEAAKPKNTLTELLLCIFLGIFGGHRFYTRKWGTAILYMCTVGIFYIGWIVDIILILNRFLKERKGLLTPAEPVVLGNVPESSDLLPVPAPDPEKLPESITAPDASPAAGMPAAPKQTKQEYIAKTHKVTGIQHYEQNLLKLASETLEWDMTKRELVDDLRIDERVWKYEFFPENVELVPEPTNPHDENAIKVIVDGLHVGYIKAGSCKSLLKLIAQDRILSISCTIGGGPYKVVCEDVNEKGNTVYNLENDSANYSVTLTVLEKPPTK